MSRRIVLVLAALAMIVAGAFAAAIAFNAPSSPPVLAAGNAIPGIAQWNFAELPKVQTVKARDGAPLNYRLYAGRPDRAVVLIHGSTGTDVSMMKLAQALQAAGASVYAVSLRGHGGSGTVNGDVSYIGQPDDDLADLVKGAGLDKPGVRRTLAGFSAGGGLVLRFAGGKQAALFDGYVAISPYIAHDSPTNKPSSDRWADAAVPRIVALSVLDGIGLPWFQGLPAIHFATDAKADDSRTPVYSFRLMMSLQLGRDWRSVLARIAAPTDIVVGADDELFDAGQFKPLMEEVNPRIGVTVVPQESHLGVIANPAGTSAVAVAWRKLAGN
jgi:pimeloyl-ACP methyl ester carboxylesterase